MPGTLLNRTRKPRHKGRAPVDELAQELALALRTDRAALLLVVTPTDALRRDAARTLTAKIEALGYEVRWLDAARVAGNDIPMALVAKRKRASTVYFVRNLTAGGQAALRALNIRRETFTAQGMRVVFWLTPSEEAVLAQQAPDFWAFRQRTFVITETAPFD